MKKIGLIAMSAKPVHLGHWSLITMAAKENDVVELFVSISNRARSKEVPIYGADMQQIWTKYIESELPPNVSVTYGGSPVGNIYSYLEEQEDNNEPMNVYSIYSDEKDLQQNFGVNSLNNVVPLLLKNNQIKMRGVSRAGGIQISGTQMRNFLKNNNKEQFFNFLPPISNSKKNDIWDILRAPVISENLIKKYINLIY